MVHHRSLLYDMTVILGFPGYLCDYVTSGNYSTSQSLVNGGNPEWIDMERSNYLRATLIQDIRPDSYNTTYKNYLQPIISSYFALITRAKALETLS